MEKIIENSEDMLLEYSQKLSLCSTAMWQMLDSANTDTVEMNTDSAFGIVKIIDEINDGIKKILMGES